MRFKILPAGIGIYLLMFFAVNYSWAAIELPKLLSNGAVLQRNTALTLEGTANPGEAVTLMFDGKNFSTEANSKGIWEITLPPQKAGGPYKMV